MPKERAPDDTATDLLVDELIDGSPAELRNRFQTAQAQMLVTIQVLRSGLESSRKVAWKHHMDIWNMALFLNMASLDLSMTIEHVVFERVEWRRKLQARNLATLVYEVTEDHTQLLGKPIRENLQALDLISKFEGPLKAAKKPLDQFWKEHQPRLKTIRNYTGAHRAHDCSEFIEMIDEINPHEIYRIGMDLGNLLIACGAFLQDVMTIAASTYPKK